MGATEAGAAETGPAETDAVAAHSWQGETVAGWRARWGVPELRVFTTVGSTNDVAAERAAAGAPEGTLILADAQTRGRGRRGRSWNAPPGSSLSMSMVFRPPSLESTRLLTLRLGLAAARALEEAAGAEGVPLHPGLKWPNDLELGGRKVAGILCEASAAHDRIVFVVAGIGLNLRAPPDGWPPEIAHRATSIQEAAAGSPGETPTIPTAPALVGRLVRHWLSVAARPADELSDDELAQFHHRDAFRDREVSVADGPPATARGITPTGALRVERDGRIAEVTAGTVRALDPTPGGRT